MKDLFVWKSELEIWSSSASLLPKWPQQLGLSQSGARSFLPGLLSG